MDRGYIKLWRAIQDNDLWFSDPFTRGQAWVDMLMLTNHKDGSIRVRGNRIPVLRGQLGWSVASLAERWGWSRGKVQRFLNELENGQQIGQQKNNVTSLITIKNYHLYQDTTDSKTSSRRTADGQQTDTNKNGKNGKKEDIGETPPPAGIPADQPSACPHKEIVSMYHNLLPVCPRVREWTADRQKALQARWREKPERQTLDWWVKFFEYVAESKFLTGRCDGRDGGAPFVATLEWLLKPKNFVKVIEGNYHREAA